MNTENRNELVSKLNSIAAKYGANTQLAQLPKAEFETGGTAWNALKMVGFCESGTAAINQRGWWNITVADFARGIINDFDGLYLITITALGYDIVAMNKNGDEVARRKTYCNPAALRQIICDAEMVGIIDWKNSTVAKPDAE